MRRELGRGDCGGVAENAAVVYSGQDFSPRGEKGRYVLPPEFRKAVIESSGGKVLCLAKHERWQCLTAFGLSREYELNAQLLHEEERAIRLGRDFDPDLRRIQLFGFKKITFDDSGRFIIPEHLAGLAGLAGDVFFQGAGSFFTLWSPDELYRMGEGWESAQAACRALAGEAGKKKRG
jgi:MraZ protein